MFALPNLIHLLDKHDTWTDCSRYPASSRCLFRKRKKPVSTSQPISRRVGPSLASAHMRHSWMPAGRVAQLPLSFSHCKPQCARDGPSLSLHVAYRTASQAAIALWHRRGAESTTAHHHQQRQLCLTADSPPSSSSLRLASRTRSLLFPRCIRLLAGQSGPKAR